MADEKTVAADAADLKRPMRIGLLLTTKLGADRATWLDGVAHGVHMGGLKGKVARGSVSAKKPFFIVIDQHETKAAPTSFIMKPSKFSQRYNIADLPLKDEPCRCGEKGCWLVKWTEEK